MVTLAAVVSYSSGVQQPRRTMAVLGVRSHTGRTASASREQGLAGSLHPGVSCPTLNQADPWHDSTHGVGKYDPRGH